MLSRRCSLQTLSALKSSLLRFTCLRIVYSLRESVNDQGSETPVYSTVKVKTADTGLSSLSAMNSFISDLKIVKVEVIIVCYPQYGTHEKLASIHSNQKCELPLSHGINVSVLEYIFIYITDDVYG